MHPVLESLRNTDKQWLIDTLFAFNAGNVEKFQALKTAWGQQVCRSTFTHIFLNVFIFTLVLINALFKLISFLFSLKKPDLAAQEAKLMQKIQLLCVMEVNTAVYY